MIVIIFLLAGVAYAADPLVCSLHGQGHVLMTDGSTRHTITGSGLADIFSTTGLDVQCDFNQTSSAQSLISSCRFLISSTTSACSVDILHGNQPGQVSIWGQTLPVTSIEEFVSANVDSALGLACHAVDDDTITIEITQRDAERFILIESSLHSIIITTWNVTSCSGACGTCQGPQSAPSADSIAVMSFHAIQPQRRCGAASGSAPVASTYPTVSAYAETAGVVPIAAFASPETRNAVIADCSDHDQARLLADSMFTGFVEACADDMALGASSAVAKSNMDTFVKVIENRQKVEMAAEALRRNPAAVICAACMSVEWDNPVNTTSVLDAANLLGSTPRSQRAKSQSMYKKSTPSTHNLYEKKIGAPQDNGVPKTAAAQEMGFPKSTSAPATSSPQMLTTAPQEMEFPKSASAPATSSPQMLTAARQEMGFPKSTVAPASSNPQISTSRPETYMPSTTESKPTPQSVIIESFTTEPSKPASTEQHKPLYEHAFKPSDEAALPSSKQTPFPFPSAPTGFEMPTSSPTSSDAMPSTSQPMTSSPSQMGITSSDALTPTPAPTNPNSALKAIQQPATSSPSSSTMPTTAPSNSTAPSSSQLQGTSSPSAQPQWPASFTTSSVPTPSPSGNGTAPLTTMPNSPSTMPNSSSTMPNSPSTMPNSSSTMPNSPTTMPNSPSTTPYPSTMPNSPSTMPNSSSTMPNSPSTMPNSPSTMPNSPSTMPNSSSAALTPSPTGNTTLGQFATSSPTSSPSSPAAFTPVPPPSPTPAPSAAAFTPVPPPSPTPAPTSSSVAAATSTTQPSTTSPSGAPTTGNTTSPRPPSSDSTPSPTTAGQSAAGVNATTMPTAMPLVPSLTSSPNSSSSMPSSSPANPSAPLTPSPNSTSAAPTSVPANSLPAGPSTTGPGPLTPAPTGSNASAAFVPSASPSVPATSSKPIPATSSSPLPTTSPSAPWVPSYMPINYSAVPTPAPTTNNGSSAMGAPRVPDRPTNSTRPPITSFPISVPFVLPSTAPSTVPSTAPQTVEIPYRPRAMVAATSSPTTAPLTGRGSVYGCHCNMSTEALKESLDKVQYALDSYLIDALTKSVLDGEDHNLLTVIACGLGGPNNANIRALTVTETEATNMCRLCELGSANNDRRSPAVPTPSTSSVYPISHRSRNLGPSSGMSPPIVSKDSTGTTTVISSLPSMSTPINNPSPASPGNGIYPNRDGFGVTSQVPAMSRAHSQAYTFAI